MDQGNVMKPLPEAEDARAEGVACHSDRRVSPLRRGDGIRRVLASAIFAVGGEAWVAADGSRTAEPETQAPQLISRTGGAGGGDVWASPSELAAAAKAGNPRAMFRYGEALVLGDQVAKDEATGIVFLRRAADLGEPSAAFRLGKLMDDGTALPKDSKRALGYYRAAAAGHVGEAFFNLGAAYASGRGVKRDYAEALAWLILARRAGIQNAGEAPVRARIQAAKRPDWLQRGEARVAELERELASRSVKEWVDVAEGRPPPPAVAAPAAPAPVRVRPAASVALPSVVPLTPAIGPPPAISLPTPEFKPTARPAKP